MDFISENILATLYSMSFWEIVAVLLGVLYLVLACVSIMLAGMRHFRHFYWHGDFLESQPADGIRAEFLLFNYGCVWLVVVAQWS